MESIIECFEDRMGCVVKNSADVNNLATNVYGKIVIVCKLNVYDVCDWF